MSEAPGVAVDKVSDTVLLVMDIQSMIVAPAPSEMLEAVARAIAGARTAGVPVVYVRVALRPGRAGVSPRNKAAHEAARRTHRGSAGPGVPSGHRPGAQ
jgi:nicotinamidase-related amidase